MQVAGSNVHDGVLFKGDKFRVVRGGKVITSNLGMGSLKIFKRDVEQVE